MIQLVLFDWLQQKSMTVFSHYTVSLLLNLTTTGNSKNKQKLTESCS